MAIEFFFDISSPYTYLAATQIDDRASEAGVEVEWKPFLLGGVFKETGNTMPAAVEARARYMFQDLGRWAELYDIDFNFPDAFPINSIAAQRALTAVYLDKPDRLRDFALELFDRYWVRNEDVSRPEVLAEAARAVDLDPDWIAERITDQEVKDALRDLTADAVERGAFGAPTFFVDDQLFFGNDRIDHVLRAAR